MKRFRMKFRSYSGVSRCGGIGGIGRMFGQRMSAKAGQLQGDDEANSGPDARVGRMPPIFPI